MISDEHLALLEELLSITEPFKDLMMPDTLKAWQSIAAITADLREEYNAD